MEAGILLADLNHQLDKHGLAFVQVGHLHPFPGRVPVTMLPTLTSARHSRIWQGQRGALLGCTCFSGSLSHPHKCPSPHPRVSRGYYMRIEEIVWLLSHV